MEFSKICNPIEESFRFMAFSSTGRRVLKEFLPRYSKGEIQIRSLDPAISMKAVGGASLTGTPAGGFVFDGQKKTIFIENGMEIGLLTPLLFHEIVHSVDEDYLNSYFRQEKLWETFRIKSKKILQAGSERTGKSFAELTACDLLIEETETIKTHQEESERFDQVRLFIAERKAYTELFILVDQLCKSLSGYSEYIRAQVERGYVLTRPITDAEIVKGYQFNSRYI
jgi:hypothetical protein